MTDLPTLLARARETWDAMTAEERQDMLRAQTRSYAIGEAWIGSDADESAWRKACTDGNYEELDRLESEAQERMRIAAEYMRKE